jgi:hypothetical protein
MLAVLPRMADELQVCIVVFPWIEIIPGPHLQR